MFRYSSVLNISGAISIFIIYFTLLLPKIVNARSLMIHDPHLDIALLFDQSFSMQSEQVKTSKIWNDLQYWIKKQFDNYGQNETRFAVMGCGSEQHDGDVDPVLYFNGDVSDDVLSNLDAVDKVISSINYVREYTIIMNLDFYDNVEGCVRSTVEKLFLTIMGDRSEAGNVVFYFSDCDTHESTFPHMKYMSILLSKSETFLFICVARKEINEDKPAQIAKNYANMLSWVKNENLIFDYTNYDDFDKLLDKVLQKKKLEVHDCEWINSSTGCINESNGRCVDKYPEITVPRTYDKYNTTSCPDVKIVRICEPWECDCNVEPWTNESCCNGVLFLVRNVSRNSNCSKGKQKQMPSCKELCSAKHGDEDVTIYIILGSLIGGILLLIFIIVVIVVVLRRAKQGGTKTEQDQRLPVRKKRKTSEKEMATELCLMMPKDSKSKMTVRKRGKGDKTTVGGKNSKLTVDKKKRQSQIGSPSSKPTKISPSSRPIKTSISKDSKTKSKPSKTAKK